MKYVYGSPIFKGYRFTVLFPETDLKDLYVATVKNLRFEYHSCGYDNPSLFANVFQLLRTGDFDIVHSHGYTSGTLTSIPAKLFRVPHIMTIHDVLLENQFPGIWGYIKKKLLQLLFNQIDVINVISDDVGKNIVEMLPGVHTNKFVSIKNGVDVKYIITVPPRDLHDEFGLDRDIFLVGFLGRFMAQKGFKYLIDAIAILLAEGSLHRDFRVVCVGSGGFIREERETILSKGLEGKFIFMPAVDNIASLLKCMNVVAIPSLWEACPLLPMEALALGIPIIASDCIGLREVVRGSPAFIIKAGDAASLADALRLSLTDCKMEAFKNYKNEARDKFNSERTAMALFNLYEQVR